MQIQQLLLEATSWFGDKVGGVPSTAWHAPTPCPDWDVSQLVTHLIDENQWIPPLLEGKTIAEATPIVERIGIADDLHLAWKDAAAQAGVAIEAATDFQTVHLSFGDFPAEFYFWQLFTDHLIHGWDLAHATSQPEEMPANLRDACLEWFRDQEEMYRSSGVIAERPRQLTNPSPQDELLNMFGRSPS